MVSGHMEIGAMNHPIARLVLSDSAYAVYLSLQDPTQWSVSQYTSTHVPSGVEFWHSNMQFHPYRPVDSRPFGVLEQRFLRHAWKKLVRNQLVIQLVSGRLQ